MSNFNFAVSGLRANARFRDINSYGNEGFVEGIKLNAPGLGRRAFTGVSFICGQAFAITTLRVPFFLGFFGC